MTISWTTAPQPSPNVSSLSFASQWLGTYSPAQTVTVTNTGGSPLDDQSGRAPAPGWAETALTCTAEPIAPGTGCSIFVSFDPSKAGAQTGTLNLVYDPGPGAGSSTATTSVGLSGTGMPPQPVTLSLAASANNPATAGQAVTFTAAVNSPAGGPTASGTVTFQTGSGSSAITHTVLVNSSGTATWTTGSLPAGNDAVNASYSGDSDYQPAKAPTLTEVIRRQLVKPSLYVAEYGSNAIGIYSSGASGRSRLGTISGAQTGLDYPEGVVLDSQGDVYVANTVADTITEYAPGASGNVAPIATISGSHTGLVAPRFLALDSSDDLYVVNGTGNSVIEYAPGANGNSGPINTISGSATMIDDPIGIAFDLGLLYVSNAGTTRSPPTRPSRSETPPRCSRCKAPTPASTARRDCSSTVSINSWSPTTAAA